jgi:hypothetical protein
MSVSRQLEFKINKKDVPDVWMNWCGGDDFPGTLALGLAGSGEHGRNPK